MAPRFALPDARGRLVSFAETPARPVVLVFWAFWCDTWKDALPHLRQLAAEREEQGFDLMAVSVDGTRVDQYERLKGPEVPFPIALDEGGAVSRRYRIRHVPTVLVIDSDRIVRYRNSGYPGNTVLLSALRRLGRSGAEALHQPDTTPNLLSVAVRDTRLGRSSIPVPRRPRRGDVRAARSMTRTAARPATASRRARPAQTGCPVGLR